MAAEIEVWRARLDLAPARLAELRSGLSAAERERESRFARPGGRERFVAARGQLREVLGERLGIEPSAVPIVPGERGKPHLDPGSALADVRFNLSHSGTLALIALAGGRELGVDLERHDPRPLERVASRVLSPGERESWRELPGEQRRAAFFAIWTRKEAYAKALGEGLALPLAEHELEPAAAGRWAISAGGRSVAGWLIADLDAAPGYSAALAVEGAPGGRGEVAIRVRDWRGR